MPHTKKQLSQRTKKDVYAIAREIADSIDAPQPAISKYTKEKLIKYIVKNQKMITINTESLESLNSPNNDDFVEETAHIVAENAGIGVEAEAEAVETVEAENEYEIIIPTPQEFFESVIELDDLDEIEEACDLLVEKLETKYTAATTSKKLTDYKKLFYDYQHPNPQLNEPSPKKDGLQHKAGKLLKLSNEAVVTLIGERKKSDRSRLGLDETGKPREVELPKTVIPIVVEKAAKLLIHNTPEDITCGILPLTGLRKNEFQMPYREYDFGKGKKIKVIHEIKAIGENLIAVKGITKKKGDTNWYIRVTLIKADLICAAREKYLGYAKVQKIKGDYNYYNNSRLRSGTESRFKEIWAEEFSTIEAYDDNGVRIDNNATPHKARAFYAWSLIPVLKANGFNRKQAKLYIQTCLGHDDPKDTDKYFNRYDDDQFVSGVDLDIPIKIDELGIISEEKVKELAEAWEEEKELQRKELAEIEDAKNKEVQLQNLSDSISVEDIENSGKLEEPSTPSYNLHELIEVFSEEHKVLITEYLAENLNPTESLKRLYKHITFEKAYEKAIVTIPKVVDRTELIVEKILIGILNYNADTPEPKDRVFPSYTLVNNLYKDLTKKQVSTVIFNRVFDRMKNDILERLEAKGIGEKHNSKYRKGMDAKIANILNYIDLTDDG